MIQPHSLRHTCMGLLAATSAVQLQADWDWKDVATAGLIGAGVGMCVYAAAQPESPQRVKRNAEHAYDTIYRTNKQLIYSQSHRRNSLDTMLDCITYKGGTIHPDYWYITSRYKSNECKQHAPLLRGHAILLNDCETLRAHRSALIDCFGSARAARFAFYHFDELEALIATLQDIARDIEHSRAFRTAQQEYKRYCAYQEELARARRNLEEAEAYMRRVTHRNSYHSPEVNYSVSLNWNG